MPAHIRRKMWAGIDTGWDDNTPTRTHRSYNAFLQFSAYLFTHHTRRVEYCSAHTRRTHGETHQAGPAPTAPGMRWYICRIWSFSDRLGLIQSVSSKMCLHYGPYSQLLHPWAGWAQRCTGPFGTSNYILYPTSYLRPGPAPCARYEIR